MWSNLGERDQKCQIKLSMYRLAGVVENPAGEKDVEKVVQLCLEVVSAVGEEYTSKKVRDREGLFALRNKLAEAKGLQQCAPPGEPKAKAKVPMKAKAKASMKAKAKASA